MCGGLLRAGCACACCPVSAEASTFWPCSRRSTREAEGLQHTRKIAQLPYRDGRCDQSLRITVVYDRAPDPRADFFERKRDAYESLQPETQRASNILESEVLDMEIEDQSDDVIIEQNIELPKKDPANPPLPNTSLPTSTGLP